ncbi:MAG: hypothetical protein KatS3mg035_1536 [Bacteroidia bacterium]|nr:MAG: hypothetical protein KatS3mg035_1536 [Bacteroidia bacterium]
MVFIISYPILFILYLLNFKSKIAYAFAFVMITPTFLSFTDKFLKRYQRHNKVSIQSAMDLEELLEKISKHLRYKHVQCSNNQIILYTSPSLLSVGEIIKIKKISHTFFIESQYPYYMEYFIPDMGIHAKNVKKIKNIFLDN